MSKCIASFSLFGGQNLPHAGFNGENGEKNAGLFGSYVAAGSFGPYQGGTPNQGNIANGDVNPITTGGYIGVGVGVTFTNATNIQQLSGPFQSFTVATPAISFGLSYGGGVWSFSISIGPGFGAAITSTTTNTRTSSRLGHC